MGLRALLQLSSFLALLSASNAQPGFISVDCGLEGDGNYTETPLGIDYSGDAAYVDGGINIEVPLRAGIDILARRYMTMRSFPDGTRNCYSLGPTIARGKYLVRAVFLYGNYDDKNQPPQFDIYLGVNLWQTVKTISDDTVSAEIIAISPSEQMQVCLVNTGSGTPFVSVLEVRPVLQTMYPQVNGTHSFVLLNKRPNFGATETLRYPVDPYDRFWFGTYMRTGWTTVKEVGNISRFDDDILQVPPEVLSTAVVAENLSYNNSINPGDNVYLFMSFTELQRLSSKDVREFNVYHDGKLWYDHYRPAYMTAGNIHTSQVGRETRFFLTLEATANSTLPPMINALEVYGLRQMTSSPTDAEDVDTISKIKGLYKVVRNWQGDPCVPQNFSWIGVGCTTSLKENSRILSLNLSRSGLVGRISPLLAKLDFLTSLDLSENNLTGGIPAEIANLTRLQVLNLKNNQLTGAIPQLLYQKSQDGTLLLSIDGNTDICNKPDSCATPESHKRKNNIPVIAGSLAAAVTIAGVVLMVCLMKGRGRKTETCAPEIADSTGNVGLRVAEKQQGLDSQREKFAFQEIVKITRNFERSIGRGGFGIVYYGSLDDGTQVAVKMIKSSSRAAKEFVAEASILMRVHHKSLVSLLGYCPENNNLAVVYEYMGNGSLARLLTDNGEDSTRLNWNIRLKIALEVALGLEYLHHFCKPCVVHRDVKPGNILLDENLQAKLGDFGLSKIFSSDDDTHISTAVAGTPGYLDPEYFQTYRLTEKSDVYSFGVVLWEIISGQPPISREPEGGQVLPLLLSKAERGDINGIADERLRGNYDENSLWKTVEIATACVSPESTSRPSMSEVVKRLKECYESVPSHEISFLSTQMPNSNDVVYSYMDSVSILSAR